MVNGSSYGTGISIPFPTNTPPDTYNITAQSTEDASLTANAVLVVLHIDIEQTNVYHSAMSTNAVTFNLTGDSYWGNDDDTVIWTGGPYNENLGTGTNISFTAYTNWPAGEHTITAYSSLRPECRDTATLHLIQVYLDIDAANTQGLGDPTQSAAERALKHAEGHPGKALAINHLDRDKDGVPDFADGFNINFGGGSQAADNASHDFVPVLFEFSDSIDPQQATVTFRGDYLSNPATDVTRTGTGTNALSPFVYEIVGDGRVRLWHNKNGSQSRNKACITAGGDAILSDVEIPLHMLSATDGVVRLYLEALKRSDELGDIEITVELNPQGAFYFNYIIEDFIKATVFDVENVHPIREDFAANQEGKVLVSARHGGGFHTTNITTVAGTPAQTSGAHVTISAYVLPVPPEDYPNLTVYFEVTDPDDLSHYEGKTEPGTPEVLGDENPNDNRDPLKSMTTGIGADYTTYQNNCLVGGRSAPVVTPVEIADVTRAVAETTLQITDRYSGDNYQVRATMQKPHNLEPFDKRTSWTTNDVYVTSSIKESETMIAWKRVYIEQDNMYKLGATITADAPAGSTNLTVDSTADFSVGDPVVIFWKDGSFNTTITNMTEHPTVEVSGGGGSGASGEVVLHNGEVIAILRTSAGNWNYTDQPDVQIIGGNPATIATANAILLEHGVGSITVTAGGSGYTSLPDVVISEPDPDYYDPVLAEAIAQVYQGVVTNVVITNPGNGYSVPPTVTITGGGGSGAAAADVKLQPTGVFRFEVTNGGSGYASEVTIDPPLPNAVPRFAGIRPAAEPDTYTVDRRYLAQAFGSRPDGSSSEGDEYPGQGAGAFIEFMDVPDNPNHKVPKYAVFPNVTVQGPYMNYWYENYNPAGNNVRYILAAARRFSPEYILPGVSQPGLYRATVFVEKNSTVVQREHTVVHEMGHLFFLSAPDEEDPPNNYSHIDALVDHKSHDGTNVCIMSYNAEDNGKTEFCIECLLIGSGDIIFGPDDSLRKQEDR